MWVCNLLRGYFSLWRHCKVSLVYRIWVDGCCQLGMTSATHLEETLVVIGCDPVWFCGRLSLWLTTEVLCNAVGGGSLSEPLMGSDWLALGKIVRPVLWPSFVPSFFYVDSLSSKLCVQEGCFPSVKPWKESGTAHDFLKQFNGMGFLRISFVYGEVKVISTVVVLDDGFSRPLTS